jgi:hypothetical protein
VSVRVHTGVPGSFCVVQIGQNWEEYIDARKSPDFGYSDIEYVCRGHLRNTVRVLNIAAPEYIVGLLRDVARTGDVAAAFDSRCAG